MNYKMEPLLISRTGTYQARRYWMSGTIDQTVEGWIVSYLDGSSIAWPEYAGSHPTDLVRRCIVFDSMDLLWDQNICDDEYPLLCEKPISEYHNVNYICMFPCCPPPSGI